MIYPSPYIKFLCHFHGDRDYFECHEVLEEHWKQSGKGRNSIWVGLIQVAVSFYHYRRGNIRGAVKLMARAIEILGEKRCGLHALGINHPELMETLINSLHRMQTGKIYSAIDLPVQDTELLAICKERLRMHGYNWGHLDNTDERIVHKHLASRSSQKHEKDDVTRNAQALV